MRFDRLFATLIVMVVFFGRHDRDHSCCALNVRPMTSGVVWQ